MTRTQRTLSALRNTHALRLVLLDLTAHPGSHAAAIGQRVGLDRTVVRNVLAGRLLPRDLVTAEDEDPEKVPVGPNGNPTRRPRRYYQLTTAGRVMAETVRRTQGGTSEDRR